VSLISATIDGLFCWFNVDLEPATVSLAKLLNIILLILWVDADSKDYPQITRPFDYGFLLYLFRLPYLPYYLWRTRGFSGLLMFAGFLSLLLLGWLIQVGIYVVRAA
jgi:hypothetical protein